MYREGNLRFKIDRASLIVGRKFTVFALFYFVFEGSFQVQDPYIWRGLFSKFYGIPALGAANICKANIRECPGV